MGVEVVGGVTSTFGQQVMPTGGWCLHNRKQDAFDRHCVCYLLTRLLMILVGSQIVSNRPTNERTKFGSAGTEPKLKTCRAVEWTVN